MKWKILGSGGSYGVPQMLCNCSTCKSTNPKNKRSRSSMLIYNKNTNILIDTSPDFKQQAIKNHINKIDALIYTHAHADHISGIDDLKPIIHAQNKILPVYMTQSTYDDIRGTYGYLFFQKTQFYKQLLEPIIIDEECKIQINDTTIEIFPQYHGEIISLGIKANNSAYSTDFHKIPEQSYKYLYNLDVWVVDCLRYSYAPTHSYYETSIDMIEKFSPKRAILTHMTHDIEYEEIRKMLPKNIEPGYDGMLF